MTRSRPMPVSTEGLGSGFKRAGGVAIELHEDQIPDFDVTAALAGELAIGVALVGRSDTHVIENFAAGAAGAGIAHGPEIIFQAGNFEDAVFGRSELEPESGCFGVSAERDAGRNFGAAENGEIQLLQRKRVPIRRGEQFHGVGHGLFLEIIAEGKISEHFEKSVMAIGEADIFQVVVFAAGAHAFLAGGGAVVVAGFEAEENVLELVHAGVGEEQRGIVGWDERRAAHDLMAALFEKFQERAADFVASPVFLRCHAVRDRLG